MHLGSVHPAEALTSSTNVTSLELVMVAVIVVLAILLWAARTKRARDQQKRKAASSGYYNPDAARFGPGTRGAHAMDPTNGDALDSSLAPSFTAPIQQRTGRTALRDRTKAPAPVQPAQVPSFPTFDLVDPASALPPPFDPAVPAFRGPDRDRAIPAAPSSAPPPPPPPPPPPVPPVMPEHRT